MKKVLTGAFVMCSLLIMSCQSGGLGGNNPEKVLSNFFEAIAKKDMKEAKKYVTKDSEGMLSMMEMGMNMSKQSDDSSFDKFNKDKMEIGKADIQGDKAYVPVVEKSSGESVKFILKKESGDWKVAFDMNTLMEMASSKMKEEGMNQDEIRDFREGTDSILKNLSPEQMKKAQEVMDSLGAHMKGLSKEQIEQTQKAMESASKMLEDMKQEKKP